ncbi:MAG: DUF421 domain-containing protein [Planctomycetes bacterium]|nr:DUF421 domain-containing protein [Planctomycetota bacterium]
MGAEALFFSGWSGPARTLVVGVAAYLALVAILRVSGKRTLSKLNAFDLVVTVALGSTLATILLSREVALAEGVTALALLVGLQWLIAWSSTRSGFVSRLVKSEPRLLALRGRLLPAALQEERVLEDEVLAALRAQGVARLEDVGAVVLETDGTLSVLSLDDEPMTALRTASAPAGVDLRREVDAQPQT